MNVSEFALARYYALQAVKQQWKARGKRFPEFGELRREANDYLDNHPELIEFATENAWADTTTAHGRLMLTVLGGLAEFERELIRARTDEGRKRAQARGVRFGRKLKLTAHKITEALQRREAGEALADIGRSYNVSHSRYRGSPMHRTETCAPAYNEIVTTLVSLIRSVMLSRMCSNGNNSGNS